MSDPLQKDLTIAKNCHKTNNTKSEGSSFDTFRNTSLNSKSPMTSWESRRARGSRKRSLVLPSTPTIRAPKKQVCSWASMSMWLSGRFSWGRGSSSWGSELPKNSFWRSATNEIIWNAKDCLFKFGLSKSQWPAMGLLIPAVWEKESGKCLWLLGWCSRKRTFLEDEPNLWLASRRTHWVWLVS